MSIMSITFNDLLTDPKYREMSERKLYSILLSKDVPNKEYKKVFHLTEEGESVSEALFNHLQKLKAESEKKAEPEYQTIYDITATPYARMVNGKIVCITKEELEIMESGVDKHFFAHGLTETSIENKQASIQITDQKAREICAKYFNCPPNEIKIV